MDTHLTPSQRVAAWRKANPEKAAAQRARHREKYREKRREAARAYQERIRKEQPERRAAQRAAWLKTEKGVLYNRTARHRRRGAVSGAEDREWMAVLLRDPCVYCGAAATEIDHVLPIGEGGTGRWDNLAPACRSCNARKNDQPLLAYMLRETA